MSYPAPHSPLHDKNGDMPLAVTDHLSSVYTGTDESSRGPTADVSDEKHSSSSSSNEKKDEEKWIWVLDPMTRKLRVPLNMLVPTHATSTPGTVPSLCIAFLEGRCRHAWCRQAHVLPSAIPQLRYEALSAPTCCHFHHDPQDISMLTDHFKYVRITGNGGNNELIPTDHIACTVGLRRYLVHNTPKKPAEQRADHSTTAGAEHKAEDADREGVLDLPAKFICRLHLAHRCRYLDDCNNIHICREFEVRLQPPPQMLSSLNSVTTSTRTVNIGDTCYTVTPLAVGDVSDDDFNAIAEAQKINYRNASTPASTPFWSVVPLADSTVGGSEGRSPLGYSSSGGVGTFPAVPDYRVTQRTPNSSLTTYVGQSPAFTHAESPSQPPQGFSGHLRIYDVRPKPQTETAASSCTNSPALNANAMERASAAKLPPPKYADCTSASASANRSVGLSAGGCLSNSTEGGVSVGTSGVNTPQADGGYLAFSGRSTCEKNRL
jgi:hypothetical protein